MAHYCVGVSTNSHTGIHQIYLATLLNYGASGSLLSHGTIWIICDHAFNEEKLGTQTKYLNVLVFHLCREQVFVPNCMSVQRKKDVSMCDREELPADILFAMPSVRRCTCFLYCLPKNFNCKGNF